MQIPTKASQNLHGRTHCCGIEEIAEAEIMQKKHALVKIVAREELPEKSDTL